MAGQLGLDPPTMKLCPGGATAELELALQNSEAVANAFSSSIYSSAIHFLVYCSAQLTSDEKVEVEQTLQAVFKMQTEPDVREAIEALNQRILCANFAIGWGPPSSTMPLDLASVLAEWRTRRAADKSTPSTFGAE